MCVPTKDLGYARNAPWRVTLPEDVVRREVNCVYIEGTDAGPIHLDAHTSTAWVVARARGEETPSEPKTSGGGRGEMMKRRMKMEMKELTPPPHSPPLEDLR
jgi:hypothetical protein